MSVTATDAQMQAFADQRIRPFAESLRLLLAQAQDHKAAITDEFTRAGSGPLWNDARTDGPPHLLASGPTSSPDDVSNFNSLLDAIISLLTTTGGSIAGHSGEYQILQRACVRPLT